LKPRATRSDNASGIGQKGAEAMISKPNPHPSMEQRIDHIRVRANDRRIAKEHLRDAEFRG